MVVNIVVCFFYLSKAFDSVWHKGLIFKLQKHGVCSNLLHWFENYLFNRKQKVMYKYMLSPFLFIHAVVRQGSILGPLLILYV